MFLILKMEDHTTIAEYQADGTWAVTLSDDFSGKIERKRMSNLELASIAALAIGDDDASLASLYEIAEPALAGLSNEVRPIP